MAPLIHLEYDNSEVSEEQTQSLSETVRDIVAEETGIKDVFVYANTAHIKVQIAPIEIFVRMTNHKITNRDALVGSIKKRLKQWKKETSFPHSINLTLIPMEWNVEIGI